MITILNGCPGALMISCWAPLVSPALAAVMVGVPAVVSL